MNHYPLSALSSTLSGKGMYKIFPNQTLFFRTLIIFSSNKLNATYGKKTTDELIPEIQEYLKCASSNLEKDMNNLHKCIYYNLLEPTNTIKVFNNNYGYNRKYFSFSDSSINASNINRTVSGTRSLPSAWVHTFCTCKDNPESMIRRIFWLLQYFCVYYCQNESDVIKIIYTAPELEMNNSDFRQYFLLTQPYISEIILQLKSKCNTFSPLIKDLSVDNFDLHVLSRIIWDILQKHYKQFQSEKISYTIPQTPDVTLISSNHKQRVFYDSQVVIYAPKTIDRYHMLTKYAPSNIYAALDLAYIYFYGETFVFEGGSNYYRILPDYKKSAEYCTLAISNSNPPFAPANWLLGHLIYTGYYSDYEKDPAKLAIAKYYFKKAGDYAPAYNSLAQIYIKEAEAIYAATHNLSDDLISKFIKAIELAGQAADLGWFYGNNVIAYFIDRHSNDNLLLSTIKQSVNLSTPFDYEQQLKDPCKNNNPWALHALATHYVSIGKKEAALPLLNKAISFNYNRAYYTLFSITENEKEAQQLLLKSSALGFPNATFDMALRAKEEKKNK